KPRDFQSRSSERRSVRLRWLIRCRRVLVEKVRSWLVCEASEGDDPSANVSFARQLTRTHQLLDRCLHTLRPPINDVTPVVLWGFEEVLHEATETRQVGGNVGD